MELYKSLASRHGWKALSQSQAATEASTSQVGRQDEFNKKAFHQHLLNFIIVDDQVHLYLLSLFIHRAYNSFFRIPSL